VNPITAQFTVAFLNILLWAVVARSLLSWFPIDQASPLYQILFKVTEPLMDPLRRVLPNMGMVDLSPMAVIIMLIVFQQLVISVTSTA
jgi:YggT family protein